MFFSSLQSPSQIKPGNLAGWRLFLMNALVWTGGVGLTVSPVRALDLDSLLENIVSEDSEIRVEAARSAPEVGVDALVPLGNLMAHNDQFVVKDVRQAMENIVHHASRPGAGKERDRAEEALLEILEKSSSSLAKNEAIFLLAFAGSEESVDVLEDALKDPELSEEAARTLEEIPDDDATEALLEVLEDAPEALQRRILVALGRRGDPDAVEDLAEFLKAAGPRLKVDVLEAIVEIGAVPEKRLALPLAGLLSERDNARLTDILIQLADLTLKGGKQERALRMYKSILDGAVMEHTACAALIGIAKIGDPKTLPIFGERLSDPSPAVRSIAADTVINWKGSDVDQLLKDRFSRAGGEDQASLLRVLNERQVDGIERILLESLDSENRAVQVTAYEILGEDPELKMEDKFRVAAEGPDAAVAKSARAGYIKMAEKALLEGDENRALSIYQRTLQFSDDPETVRRGLSGLAGLARAESAEMVKRLIDEGRSVEDAARTYLTIAEAVGEGGDKDTQKKMILEIIDHPHSGSVRNTALEQFSALGHDSSVFAKSRGFLTEWWITGPFPNENGAAYEAAYFPEEGVQIEKGGESEGKQYSWKEASSHDIPAKISLSSEFEKNQFVCAYAYTEIESKRDRPILFLVGTNDGCEFWVNGERLHGINQPRGCNCDQGSDRIQTQLKKGKNKVLLKILQEAGGWEFCVRLADTDGNPINLSTADALD